ncbi:hypothetical protein Anas_07678 [Armadillidium nasatum]|uniref:Uncharacterized protein n=1 Tax=Armadillidium nasatum TaxID=96803 RepID=A0A5N5SJS9_9CRUS|nr:hypothetical protein Anas_07678 [Armadillidium nasatum]
MIQHCKSKEHLLKVMELLNPDCADIYSKKGTDHEILSILNCRSGDLDKDGVSFAPLSTFLSVRKVIFKRILALRKKPVKAKEDWTKTNLSKTLTPVQSPKRTPSSLSSSSVSSSPKNKGGNDCSKDVKDSSIVEGAKARKIISLKRKSCYDNQTSPPKPEKELCTPAKEKKKEIQKMLDVPGHSFVLVLSDKIGEEKDVYDCVLCYQYSQRTTLEGIIQHCKSRDHLLKVMSRAGELDKDGVTFAPLSTFFSVRASMFKRVLDLLKNPVKEKEDWTNIIPRETLTPIKSPETEQTNPCLSSKSLSSAKDIDSNANVTALSKSKPLSKNMSLVKPESSIPKSKITVKNSSVNSELEKSNGKMPKCEKVVGNEDSNDAILNLKKKNIKMSSLSSTKSSGSSKCNNFAMEGKTSTNITNAKCRPVRVVKKNESSQPGSNPKVTDDDKEKKLEEKKKEIRKILNIPGHSFILVLSDRIGEEKEVFDCVLCYQHSQRTNLEGMIQHCKSRDHLLKVMDLVNRKCAAFYSKKGTELEITSILKVFLKILSRTKEDWTNIIPRKTLTPIKSPESERTHPRLSSKSLSSAKDIDSNANVTALSKSKPLSKNMSLVKPESSIPKSKITVKNSSVNSELEKSNLKMPKCEKVVGNEDSNDAILNLKKKNLKMSSLPNTKSLASSQNNNSAMESKTSTNIGDAKCSPATVVKKNESLQPYSDPKVTDDIKGKTFEEKKLEIQKALHTPGHSFILVLNEKIDEDQKAYDCVLCHKNTQRTSLEGIIQHCKSKDHMLKVMELVNPKYAEFYSEKGSAFEIIAVLKIR